MAFKRKNKTKEAGQGGGKPERITNKLDHVLIAESRQSIMRKWRTFSHRQRVAITVLAGLVVIGVAGGVFTAMNQEDTPPPKPAAEEPKYDESTGSIIFEYKPKQ